MRLDYLEQVKQDPTTYAAYVENNLRNEMVEVLRNEMLRQNITDTYLCDLAGISNAQALLLFQHEQGGHLYLNTIVRVANCLGLEVEIKFIEEGEG